MLIVDAQTLKDTGIFQKEGGIYALYRQTVTRGGAYIVEEFLRMPLSDAGKINQRLGIIRYFSAAGMEFPFDPADLDAVELYLSETDERTRLVRGEQSLGQKLTGLVAADTKYKTIVKGIESLVNLLVKAQTFVENKIIRDNTDYEEERSAIEALLKVIGPIDDGRLSRDQLVDYDSLLRFRHVTETKKLLRYIYKVDAYQSIGRVAVERKFCFPVALAATAVGPTLLMLRDVRHPAVKGAIGNSLFLDNNKNVLFLTGANMAGKSTFMKSVAIAVYLAHTGLPVLAEQMQFTALDGFFTTINLPDNLGAGASHFYTEVLRVKQVAQELHSGRRLLVLFDELFRGTNVKDAEEATIAVVTGFADMSDSLFIVSTHIVEAGETLKSMTDAIQYRCLPTKMDGHHPVYTYRLEEGITEDRHGMIIIRNEGILEMLGVVEIKN